MWTKLKMLKAFRQLSLASGIKWSHIRSCDSFVLKGLNGTHDLSNAWLLFWSNFFLGHNLPQIDGSSIQRIPQVLYSIPCKRHWSLILSSMVDFYTGIYQFQAEVCSRNLWNMHQWSIYTVFTRWLVRQDQTAKETKRRMIIHRFLLFLQVLHDRNRHKSKSQQFEKHYTTKLFHHGDGSFFYCSPISMLRQCFALLCTVTGGSVYLYLLLTCLFIFICWSFLILFFLFFIYRCRKMKKTTNA